MRVLLDTNVLVSALIKKGKPRILLDSVLAERHKLIISRPIVEELSKVLADRRIRRYVTAEDTTSFIRLLTATPMIVDTRSRFSLLNTPDDVILRTAYDGRAELIVTGDGHLLSLGSFKGIKIMSVSDAVALLST